MQKIVVFQQNGTGRTKVDGMNRFGDKQFRIETVDIDEPLPEFIDDTSRYIPDTLDADLVLDYLKHRDLSDDLSLLCDRLGIPVIASGKKIATGNAICPPTCCTLAKYSHLGDYGNLFGTPEIKVATDGDKISHIEVIKGAPCGATWHAAQKIKEMPVEDAMTRFGLEVQFCCTANPAAWDPLWGKSSVHVAADIHSAALKTGLKHRK
ncbi:MAG: DUF166 domain-containing protein [Desulfobacterales bacterium]|nr:DUF166 domain-containing protein [Desulfobacterales bacterium]